MGILIYFLWFIFLLAGAYFIGTFIEAAHYKEIKKREEELLQIPVVTSKSIEAKSDILSAELVYGNVVVSLDYFKRFLAGLRNIAGGRVKSYESLIDRGRREAVLRMKEQASALGANIVFNLRYETSNIGQVTNQKGSLGCIELLAYGTAARLKDR